MIELVVQTGDDHFHVGRVGGRNHQVDESVTGLNSLGARAGNQ